MSQATESFPTPHEQLVFLRNIQRLLREGDFVTTYKFALLHAIADLSVTRGSDNKVPLELSTLQIAERMIELYWGQAMPFPVPGAQLPITLQQNTNPVEQASILRHLAKKQHEFGPSLARFQNDSLEWNRLTRDVDVVVRKMPLWKLQRMGGEIVDFLYENVGAGSTITLRPGVASCFRQFHGIVIELVQSAWLRYVRRYNLTSLNEVADLEKFLFGDARSGLIRYVPMLRDIQKDLCFYCGGQFNSAWDVDHFIPFSRFSVDLGHNFVLAHPACNRQKSDHIAAERHLAAWIDRNTTGEAMIRDALGTIGVHHDLGASVRVARWAYTQIADSGGRVWVQGRTFEHLSPQWSTLLAG